MHQIGHFFIHNRVPLGHILRQIGTVQTLPFYVSEILFSSIFPSITKSFTRSNSFEFPNQKLVHTIPFIYTCHMSHSFSFLILSHKKIWWKIKVIETFITGFSSVPCHVSWLGPKYLFQQPIIWFSFSIGDRISRPYTAKDTTAVRNISIPILFGKGNAIPLQTWTDPEGFRRLKLPDFNTIGSWKW